MNITSGRPRADGKLPGGFVLTELYKTLRDGFPQFCETKLDHDSKTVQVLKIEALANDLGYSRTHVYRSLENESLSIEAAKKIVAKSGGTIELKDLKSYVPEKFRDLIED